MSRLENNYNKSFQAKNNQPTFVVESESDTWLEDILINYSVKVVYGYDNTLDINQKRVELLTPKLLRNILRNRKLCIERIKGPLSSFNRNQIIVKLLCFVLKDKAYEDF